MTAWSHSALDAFDQCPRRYKLTRITKEVIEPQTEATKNGNEIHKALELAIKGEVPLPAKFDQYRPLVQKCVSAAGEKLVEYRWAVTDSYRSTTYFGKDVWCRGVIDFGTIQNGRAVLIDWKTGKMKESDQLALSAAAMFAIRPDIVSVSTGFAWLKDGRMICDTLKRVEIAEVWLRFLPRVRRLEAAIKNDDFPPRPGGLCKEWCPVKRHQCEFSGRR